MTKSKVASDFLDDNCGSCRFFNQVGKKWLCCVNPPEFIYLDEDLDPPAPIYTRGGFETQSSAPACKEFIVKRIN